MAVFDFRSQQERVRRATGMLVLVFIAMVAVISLAVGALVTLAISAEAGSNPVQLDLDPARVLMFAFAAMSAIMIMALFRLVSLGGDGASVARALGAEEVAEDTRNAFQRRYLNVVEEMAIAAGLPRPRAFVLRHEPAINAFAAGSSPERAVVCVTHGALARLNRQELTGVVAHEMAHIANHDTRLNMRLMGMVFGLVALYMLGRGIMRSFLFVRRRNNKGAAPAMLIGVGLIVLGLLGVLGGRILQSAVSRRREYLADATGVQFTRNPHGLANALKKIGAASAGSRVGNAHAEEARHMFFASATGTFAGLFATHPPLVERIRKLEPRFDPGADPLWKMDDRTIMLEARRGLDR